MSGIVTRWVLAAGLPAALFSLSACGPGYQDLPLPGTGAEGDSYRLEVAFDDAVNLAQGAQVKVGGLPVGRVQQVRVSGFKAVAELDIESDVSIPTGSTARLRYDTPLGELFVELDPAATGEPLGDGDEITARDTSTAPSVEDTLAQASLLINGGGLTELQTINEELNTAIGGREDVVRDVLGRSLDLLRGVNAGSHDLDGLLRDLSEASQALTERRGVFKEALAELGPLADVLREETPKLNRLLQRTTTVTARANSVMARTQDQTVQILEQLGPILEEILSAEPEFVHGLTAVQNADALLRQMIPGDFLPLQAIINLDLTRLLDDSQGGDPAPDDDNGGLLPDLPGVVSGPGPLPDTLADLLGGLGRNRQERDR